MSTSLARLPGVIAVNRDVARVPFVHGAAFNEYWRWVHPRLCHAPRAGPRAAADGNCFLAAHCPGPHLINAGLVGVTLHKDMLSRSPFHVGGEFNHLWQWVHAHLCCWTSVNDGVTIVH